MVKIREVTIRTYVHESEDISKVKEALNLLLPGEVKINEKIVSGFYKTKIIILESNISKKDKIKRFIEKFNEHLPEESRILLEATLSDRLDDKFSLYIRVDKQTLYQKKKILITEEEDCIWIKISFDVTKKERLAGNVLDKIKEVLMI